jgi:hypothetical protein
MNRDIPGFYYDPEKKKYFKIQANHKSTPGSQYSKDAVKRKRLDQEVVFHLPLAGYISDVADYFTEATTESALYPES